MAQIVSADLLGQSKTPLFVPGDVYTAPTGERYVYGQYNGSHTAGRFSIQSDDAAYDFTPMTTTLVGTPGTHWKNLGVPCCDGTDNYYGWFWIGFGYFKCVIENSFAAADIVYTTANAGLPGTNSSSFALDGFKSLAAGVTSTRVACVCAGRLTAGVTSAHDI